MKSSCSLFRQFLFQGPFNFIYYYWRKRKIEKKEPLVGFFPSQFFVFLHRTLYTFASRYDISARFRYGQWW